ncbi:hypothetical protein D910_09210 [Dendroctonus ponderosae]
MWKETPIPMYLEFHMFNWTNAHLVAKDSGIKPAFVDLGPYVFYEHHIRDNVTFHDNDTITYLNKRLWHFEADKSNGTLEDVITILNPLVVIVANVIKDEHYLVKRAVNFFLEEKGESLFLHKNVRELLFDGYDDGLIDIALKLNISGFNLPFTKFGWFVDRNGSATYDGVFNMYSGGNDIRKLGLITRWNYEHETSYYPGECAVVNGSSGELWYAPHDDKEVAIFSPDMCSNVKLHRSGTFTLYGIEGNEYVGQDDVFDNGTKYESSKCYASGVRTGVKVENSTSAKRHIAEGVPQGPVISPLLHTLYATYISKLPTTKIAQYADDMAILHIVLLCSCCGISHCTSPEFIDAVFRQMET